MAINFFRVKAIKRTKKQSALAKAAYITRGVYFDELSGKSYDFRYRGNALHSEILIPPDSPLWLIGGSLCRQKLWTLVERNEKRRDAQLAREFVVALPCELSLDQLIKLANEYILVNFVSKGMVADYSIHAPNPGGDPRNIHMHIMVTMRLIGPDGFLLKERQWNDKKQLFEVRRNWMDCANRYLELNLCPERIEYSRLKRRVHCQESTIGMSDAHLSTLLVVDRSVGDLKGTPQKISDFFSETLQYYHRSETITEVDNLTEEKRYWLNQYTEIQREISLENIERDISRRRVLCAEDFYNLGKDELEKIKRLGLEYFCCLINKMGRQRTFERER